MNKEGFELVKNSLSRSRRIDTEQSQQSTQEILKERVIPLAEKCHTDLTDHTDNSPAETPPLMEEESLRSERSVCDIDPNSAIIQGE